MDRPKATLASAQNDLKYKEMKKRDRQENFAVGVTITKLDVHIEAIEEVLKT